MRITKTSTFTADIYVGMIPGYNDNSVSYYEANDKVTFICQKYCDAIGLGVTIQFVDFVYTGGMEHGFKIGLINYPRFPSTPYVITDHAITLAKILKHALKQERVTIITSTDTIMLGEM